MNKEHNCERDTGSHIQSTGLHFHSGTGGETGKNPHGQPAYDRAKGIGDQIIDIRRTVCKQLENFDSKR